jgi:hypothetical protein
MYVCCYWVNALTELGFEFYKAKKIKTIMIKGAVVNFIYSFRIFSCIGISYCSSPIMSYQIDFTIS